MIATFEAIAPTAPAVVKKDPTPQERANRILDLATYCGPQETGAGDVIHLWTLLKAIPGHTRGSTIAQATLEKYLFGKSFT